MEKQGFFQRLVGRVKSAFRNDSTLVISGDPKVLELFGVNAGSIAVNEQTAMQVSAVSACIQILGGTIASLPIHIYRNIGEEDRERVKTPLSTLLNVEPCPAWTASAMVEWWIRCVALRGDAYTEIIRDGFGNVSRLVPLHPATVTPVVLEDGHIIYKVVGSKKERVIPDFRMLHIPGAGYDGTTGTSRSVISDAASSIRIAIASDNHSENFFSNGVTTKHALKAPGVLTEEQVQALRNRWKEKYTGISNYGSPMVLTEGMDVQELSMSSVDAELLASRKYQVIDIARAFGVPPFMIGAQETTTSWGTGIEQMTIGFVRFTLSRYLKRIQDELNRKLFDTQSDMFVEFNLKGLLKGDAKAEGESLRQARGGSQGPGWMTLNEIRKINNLPSIAGGDEIYDPIGGANEPKDTGTNAGPDNQQA